MAQLGADGRCLMRALQEELDDPAPTDCGRCSVCAGPRYDGPLDEALVRQASLHLRSRPLILEAKKMAPDAQGAMKKIPEGVRVEEGRALARLGDGGWDPLVRQGRRERPLRRRAGRGGRRGRAQLGRAGGVGDGGAVAAQRRARAGLRAPARGAPRAALRARCSSASATRRRSARWPTPSSRSPTCAGSSRSRATRPRRAVPAGRRHPLQRLDARDGRRPAARARRRARSTRSRSRPRSSGSFALRGRRRPG